MNMLLAVVCGVLCLGGAVDDRAAPAAMIETARLEASIRGLPTKRAARGDVAHQKGLLETEALLELWLKDLGYTPRRLPLTWNLKYQADEEKKAGVPESQQAPETNAGLAERTWHNIVVELPGKTLPKEVLILACHFDAVPGAPGADDNGTGVAALLEIARVLKGVPMERTVRMIFFNLEEVGLRGSMEYVKRDLPKDEKVIGMVSLEMLGYFTDAPNSQRSPIGKIEGVFDPPTVGDFIAIATIQKFSEFARRLDAEMRAAAPGLKTVVADFMPVAPPDFLRSDHAPFMLTGKPGVMLTDTSNFRNPHYHKPTDTIETLDMERFTLVVRGVAGAAHAIAGPIPPAPKAPGANEKPRTGEARGDGSGK
ncbi:MAG: M20/M25/M40 family metallo-hydrolase [Phycisphaeraceae bacterium]|nr:M20/M25/M40 family metallo-hydrolase [Phycisphaeraceae bacterium]